jgi:creatinine amidohydrolase
MKLSEFFNYADLTSPEINALPRDIPLVLPLGVGYSLAAAAETMGNPKRIGLLPFIPFGWKGSGLEVSENLLTGLINNLLDNLSEDGFSNGFVLAQEGIDLELENPRRIIYSQTTNSHVVLSPDVDREKVVLIPIGHTEQHAYHLPLSTDTVIIDNICQGVAAAIPDRAITLPVMPYGVSMHRSSFMGTFNIGGRIFEDFWLDVINRLAEWGFKRVYLLSGHGGNCSFLVNVAKYAGERHPQMFCATSWLYLSGPAGIESLEKHRRSKTGGMGHACELETSLMLYLRPELVHMDKVVDETDFIATPSYYMDWVEGGALIANPPWEDDTLSGAYGAGSLAKVENGEIWFKTAVQEKVDQVNEIIEQSNRRIERRKSGYGLWKGKKT